MIRFLTTVRSNLKNLVSPFIMIVYFPACFFIKCLGNSCILQTYKVPPVGGLSFGARCLTVITLKTWHGCCLG